MVVPMYNAEISPPSHRGLLSGLLQQMLSFGYVAANWIGYGASFFNDDRQWRVGLSIQIVWAALLFIGLFFVPFSPRWLIQQGREDEARAVLQSLHYNGSNQAWLDAEFEEIKAQHAIDMSQKKATLVDLVKTKPMFKRTALAVGVQCVISVS